MLAAAQWRAGMTETRFVPEMNTGPIANFDLGTQIREKRLPTPDDRILRRTTGIYDVMVKDVVVLDIFGHGTIGQNIPHALVKASGHQPGIVCSEAVDLLKDRFIRWITARHLKE